MKIEIKNVKYSEFASEETACFEAFVYIDGKREGEVSNHGQGGPDEFHPFELQKKLDEYGKTLPKTACNFDDPKTGKPWEMEQNAESLIGGLLDTHLRTKDLKRALKKRVLFIKEGKIFETKNLSRFQLSETLASPDIKKKFRTDTVLNLLPFEEAMEIYGSHS